jgi:hypothetical protein
MPTWKVVFRPSVLPLGARPLPEAAVAQQNVELLRLGVS